MNTQSTVIEPDFEIVAPNVNPILWCKGQWNGFQWDWSLDDYSGAPSGNKHNLRLIEKQGPYVITIKLEVPKDSGVSFDTTNPIDIDELGYPPDKGNCTKQISSVNCTADELILKNENKGKKRTLYYYLNFKNANPCDPQFRNGGGR